MSIFRRLCEICRAPASTGLGIRVIITGATDGDSGGGGLGTDGWLFEGDMQSGTDRWLLEGDVQSGTDIWLLEGDMQDG